MLKKMMDGKKCMDCALLVLRLAAGLIFVLHGYGKLFGHAPGMEAFTGMVAGLGFPAPGFFSYIAALSEFFGGIALILGVGVQYASVFLAIVMLVAWGGMKKFSLPMGDPDFALLAISVALFMTGGGKHTIMSLLGKKDGTS
jgi:putative oxidoreductase